MVNGYLNYMGSKYKLLDQILPEMDYSKSQFIDLFTGSFVVGANVVDKYDKVIANDIIKELIGIHKGVLESDDIIDKTKLLCPEKDDTKSFLELRESFNKEKSPDKLWALILSCNSNMMRFNKSLLFNQTHGKRTWNDSTTKKVNEFINLIRPYREKISFISGHFKDVKVDRPSMVYIDSPYTGSEAGYNSYWNKEDDDILYEYCKYLDSNGSSFMLSGILGEHKPGVRWKLIDKLISDGYKYKILDFDYEKIAKIKNEKNSQEVIIMNY